MTPRLFHFDGFRLGRGQNDRGSWQVQASRAKKERARVATELWLLYLQRGAPGSEPSAFRHEVGKGPWLVEITRCSPSPKPLDTDNLSASCKHVRDALAE
jgi:hypothetical protein